MNPAARAAVPTLAALVVLAMPVESRAEPTRYSIVIGNNTGSAEDGALAYAERDAERIADVLVSIGDVAPENQIVVRGHSAEAARRALIAQNEKIRSRASTEPSVLIVYYSGHGDERALHLGASELSLREIEGLVRGSSATIRILIIDACRSGALTRVKGGRPAPASVLKADDSHLGEGTVFLTSSAAGEDAQESDDLGGSFFTHYLISGLVGGADEDLDGAVSLGEAYRYAQEQTIVASSKTLAGIQHPTFRLDLAGRDDVTITRPRARGRSLLALPKGAAWLVVRSGAGGGVVAELSATATSRTISVPPQSYQLRGRYPSYLVEGSVTTRIDQLVTVHERDLSRTELARLARKGGHVIDGVDGPTVGWLIQTSPLTDVPSCTGPLIGWLWERAHCNVTSRLSACRSRWEAAPVTATSDALGGELRVSRAIDLPHVTLDAGISLGAAVLHQSFMTTRTAPDRWVPTGHVAASVAAQVEISRRAFVLVELAVQSHVLEVRAEDDDLTVARVAGRVAVLLGWRR